VVPRCGGDLDPAAAWLGGVLLLLFFLGLPIYLYFFALATGPVEFIYVSGGLVVGAVFVIAYGCRVVAGGPARARILRAGEPEPD
jgi:hypothetical protein